MHLNDLAALAPALMAAGIPLLAIAGFVATRLTDETEAWTQRYGVITLLGAGLAYLTHLPQALVASAFLTGIACVGAYIYLRRRLESY
jgi:hypothetical protein